MHCCDMKGLFSVAKTQPLPQHALVKNSQNTTFEKMVQEKRRLRVRFEAGRAARQPRALWGPA